MEKALVKVSLEEMENLKEMVKVSAKVRERAEPKATTEEKVSAYRLAQESEPEAP